MEESKENDGIRPASELIVSIKSTDMESPHNPKLQDQVIACCVNAIKELNMEKDMAERIKKELEEMDKSRDGVNTSWQVIVGRSFGSFVTHEKNRFLYFYVGSFAVLVFKA